MPVLGNMSAIFQNRNKKPYNWLVHRIHDQSLAQCIEKHASGILVDIGCGEKPYADLTRGVVSKHIGVDYSGTDHDRSNIDTFATAYETTLTDAFADTVLCTSVLEHLERPQEAVREMFRILRPGGRVILSAPFFWHLHEEPRDFFRYSKFGLQYLFESAGFEVIELRALSGFIVTFSQELCYFLNRFNRGPLKVLLRPAQFLIQTVAYFLSRWDRSERYSWAHLAVARKPA
jgi:SAM-dependent methyltransferase